MATQYFEPGAMAMTHTESQMEWCNRRAAMIFCGAWLKHEMQNSLPDDFEMASFRGSARRRGGKGDPRALYAGGDENFFIFAQAKHPKEAADFLEIPDEYRSRPTSTPNNWTRSHPSRAARKGVAISPALQSAVTVLHQQRSGSFRTDWARPLPDVRYKSIVQDSLSLLVAGKLTPEQFGQRLWKRARTPFVKTPRFTSPPAMTVTPAGRCGRPRQMGSKRP